MGKIVFNSRQPDLEALRRMMFERLRTDSHWKSFNGLGNDYSGYVDSDGHSSQQQLADFILQVFWQLVTEGVLAPGNGGQSPNLPHFHITEYGRKVIQSGESNPHDPTGYVDQLRQKVPNPDATVMAYLLESLNSMRRGSPVASTVMLGIAAERVFVLVGESLENALSDANEKNDLRRVLNRYPMKPKLDGIHDKIQRIQEQRLRGFPDNASLMVTAIYDLIRCQRNELGHPRDLPPSTSKEDAFVNLQIFPRYYETSETVRAFLATSSV
jgi:hypothetical protein